MPRPNSFVSIRLAARAAFFAITLAWGAGSANGVEASFPQYRVVDLGTLPGFPITTPIDLNDRGEIVGRLFNNTSPFIDIPFYWSEATGMRRFSSLSGEDVAVVSQINNHGLMLGRTRDNDPTSPRTPFLYDPVNGYRVLDGFEGAEVNDLNDRGEIVGQYRRGANSFVQFVWSEAGGAQNVSRNGHGPDGDWDDARFIGINNEGVVAASLSAPESQGALWTEADGFTPIGKRPEHVLAGANDVNDRGEVIGGGTFTLDGRGVSTSFYWSESVGLVPFGNLPGNNYESAQDINELGWVVGSSNSTGVGAPRGYLWSLEEGMVDLNDLLIEESQDWFIRTTSSINNHGWILATGVNNGPGRGVLLIPIPEPGSCAMALIVIALGCVPRRPKA